ncbi:MAG: tRNA pseudouridine(55) synthase TruB [Clostridia bacterium]|nr:tRNA pseudouridine(55) synthase TruB [Clostridia bacterium]
MTKPTETTASGVIIIHKPAGMTSHDVVNKMRRLYATRKVGHTGTLDPMATGVLPILIGGATKAAELITAEDKGYTATLKLGMTTDTGDTTGAILTEGAPLPTAAQVEAALDSFRGEIMQIPPMYSALKVDGKKLCDLARQGIEVERQARPVTIHSLKMEVIDETAGEYRLEVLCSKGTYIRTLCCDIGEALGCGGVMASLVRTRSGSFTLEQSYTLEELAEMELSARQALLIPCEALFADLAKLTLKPFFEHLARNGQPVYLRKIGLHAAPGTRFAVYGEEGFFALGEIGEQEGEPVLRLIKRF